MKIRRGFVSNSSTTSFCVYGVCFDASKVHKMLDEIIPKNFPDIEYNCEDIYEIATSLKNVKDCATLGQLQFEYAPGDYIYVGVSPVSMKDEETLSQFKYRTKDAVRLVLGDIDDSKFSFHTEGFNDNF